MWRPRSATWNDERMNSKALNEDTFTTLEERAAYWHLRLSSDDCAPEERYAFEAWKRQSPDHAAAFEKVRRGAAFIDRHVAEPELRRLGKETLERTAPPFYRESWFKPAALAASLILALGLGTFALTSVNRPSIDTMILQVEAYETAIGERSTVTLSDGSEVTLNTNSRIEVDYSAQGRNVRLIRGQGFFEVAKDVDRPFAVEAGERRVVALGTAFDVRYDNANDIAVTLLEGRVSVGDIIHTAPAPNSTEAIMATQSVVELSPGQRLVAKGDAAPEIADTNAEEATAWRDGRLIFRGEPIGAVIAEMNRYSIQQLKLSDDPRLREMTVSGVFNTGRASTFVDALERMHPLQAERSGANELTLMWHE